MNEDLAVGTLVVYRPLKGQDFVSLYIGDGRWLFQDGKIGYRPLRAQRVRIETRRGNPSFSVL